MFSVVIAASPGEGMTEKFDSHANAVVNLCQLTDVQSTNLLHSKYIYTRCSSRNSSVALAKLVEMHSTGTTIGSFSGPEVPSTT